MTHVLNHVVHPGRTHRSASRLVRRRLLVLLWTLLFLVHSANLSQVVHAATAGIPFDEPFDESNLQDPLLTNANWSTEEEALFLAWRKARFGTFGPESVGSNIVYTWDFGDGNSGSGATSSHIYSATGVYTATVTASNGTDSQLATTQVAVVHFLPPSPLNDAAATLETQAVAGNVLANDTDPQASPLTVSAFTQPAHGSVTLADNGDYTYTPAADFTGVDSFSYTVSNSHQLTATAHVFIVVKPLAASEGPPQQLVATPGVSTTHTISDGGFQITVEVPAVNDSGTQQAQVVLYTPLPTTTVDVDAAPGAFQFGGLLFSLEFYVNGELQEGYQFPSPLLLTITYPEDALAGLVASSATLLYWNGTAWASDGIEVVAHDMALRTLTLAISHLTEFGLFAAPEPTNEAQTPQPGEPVEIFKPALSR